MSLTPDDVQKIAHLARLGVTEQEKSSVASDLTNILDLVEQMNQVDTSDVVPMSHPLHMTQRLRPDEVTETNQRDKFQSISPVVENGLFLVPRVIE
jgi:aspartyl-tRNA(Asn)/glutamyl-tRNA(Gln) amidotransferase subunit C